MRYNNHDTISTYSDTTQLAKKYHPDRNEGDPEAAKKFTKIGEAYEVSTVLHILSLMKCLKIQVLSDSQKRNMYDHSGFSEYNSTGGFGGESPFTTMRAEEIFKQFFGGDVGSMFGQEFGGGSSGFSQQVLAAYQLWRL